MNYSYRFKVDGINIKDLKPGIYNTFYFRDDGRRINISKSTHEHTIKVIRNDISIVISCLEGNHVSKHHFNLDGKLFMKESDYSSIKYLDKHGILYRMGNGSIKQYSIIKHRLSERIIYYKNPQPILGSSIVLNTYYFNNMKINLFELGNMKTEEIQKERFNIIWNPKDLDLYIPRIIIKEFLHIYFLLKIFLISKKINNKDLRQYIFRFLFDL
jgi:hypothetical protein